MSRIAPGDAIRRWRILTFMPRLLRPARVIAIAALLALPIRLTAQDASAAAIDTVLARRYFREAAALTDRDAGRLWGRSLSGPLLFVDRTSRMILTDRPDAEGRLQPLGGFFSGTLPASENVSNTGFQWGGVLWAMIAWPIKADSQERGVLLVHELWHRMQDSLGFGLADPANAHLASRDGRLWLRLEGRALRRALTLDGAGRSRALRDAVAFRRTRRRLFPGSDSAERALELNEGLAEYSGVALGGGTEAARRALVDDRLVVLDSANRFERSFAYQTGPAYGFFLDVLAPGWRAALTPKSDLAFVLEAALPGSGPLRPPAAVTRAAAYGYARVRKEEQTRATRQLAHQAALRRRFVGGPLLELPLREMKMGIDPGQVETMDSLGTVYGSLRLTDRWGVLQSDSSGGLISADFRRAIVPAPADVTGRRLTGPGWVLELLPGWEIVPGARKGDWTVQRAAP